MPLLSHADLDHSHSLQHRNLGEFEGTQVAGVKIETFARSEMKQGEQITELTLDGLERTWKGRCVQTVRTSGTRIACQLHEGDAESPLTMVLTGEGSEALQGYVLGAGRGGAQEMRLHGIGTTLADGYTTAIEFRALDEKITLGKWDLTQGRPTLRIDAATDHHLLGQMAALSLTLHAVDDLRPDRGVTMLGTLDQSFLDGYPLKPVAREAPGRDAHLDRLEALGLDSHARGLAHKLSRDSDTALDLEAGMLLEREPGVLRPAMELAIGGDPSATQTGVIGVGVGLRAGLRGNVLLKMELMVGGVDSEQLRDSVGAFDTQSSGGFAIGVHGRYALNGITGIEPVVGVQVRGRLMSVDLVPDARVDTEVGSLQLGLGVAPTLGLQTVWSLNDMGTQLTFFAEVIPEWTWWSDPSIADQPNGSREALLADQLDSYMRGNQFQVMGMMGARFEL
ncbi:MAG: hypothetical protein ACE366_04760 [Bradymonadia bacterium]